MKYVITGSIGHISKPIVSALLKAGHEVVVITSKHDRAEDIKAMKAIPAVGSLEDAAFLTKTFAKAHAVYTMVPPVQDVKDWKAHIEKVGKNYADAIKANNVKYVVNLSSVGAHMADGAGPVSGLYRAEQQLNELEVLNVVHLRPGYFYYNLFNNIDLAKNMGIIGGNFEFHDKKFILADPADIAAVAIDELLTLNFSGHQVQYIVSDEVSTDEVANVLGNAIGKPDLKWVRFTDEQSVQGGVQAGLPEELAKNYAEMGHAMQEGKLTEDYWSHRPSVLGKIKLADFAKKFAAAYNNQVPAAAH